MYCFHCGYKLDDMANFCPVCGTRRAVIDVNALSAQPIVSEPAPTAQPTPAPASPVEKASGSDETATAEQADADVPAAPSIPAAAQTDERKAPDDPAVTTIPSPVSDTASGKQADRITVTLPKLHIPKIGAKKVEKTKKENVRTAPAASRFQVLAKLKEKFMQLSLVKKILTAAGTTIVLLMVSLVLCFGPKGAFMFVAYGNMNGPLYPRMSISSFIHQYRLNKKLRDFHPQKYGVDPNDHKQENETSASKSTSTDDGKSAIDELLEKHGQKQDSTKQESKTESKSSSSDDGKSAIDELLEKHGQKQDSTKQESKTESKSSSSDDGKSAIDELLEKHGQKQDSTKQESKTESKSSSSDDGKSAIDELLEKHGQKQDSTKQESKSSSSDDGKSAIDELLEKYGKTENDSNKSESSKSENSSDEDFYDRDCPDCYNGDCRSCGGRGYTESYSPGLGREKEDCWRCSNGNCTRCGGDGKL